MPVDCPDRRWYAIRTKPRFEKVVRDQLADRGLETLLPLRKRTSQWKNRTKLIEAALFTGYCFGWFSPTQRALVLRSPGVLDTLNNHDVSEPIIAEEMAGVQRLVKSSLPYRAHLDAVDGAIVEITRGPLVGVRGTSLRHGDHSWVVMRISLIGKAVAVEIQLNDLKAIPDDNLS